MLLSQPSKMPLVSQCGHSIAPHGPSDFSDHNVGIPVAPSPTEVDEELDFCSAQALDLRPSSIYSVMAFDMLCQSLDRQPLTKDSQHHLGFVTRSPSMKTVQDAIGHWEDPLSSGDEEDRSHVADRRIQSGSFLLSYAEAPSWPLLGWRMGCGKPMLGPVDFCIPQHPDWPHLRGFHIAIKLDDKGQFVLEALRNSVKLDGESMQPGETRRLSKMVHYLSIANGLDYEIKYRCAEHLRELNRQWRTLFMQQHLSKSDPDIRMPVTPAEYVSQRGDWMIGAVVGRGGVATPGGRTVVRVGSHAKRSEVVAVKEIFYQTCEDWEQVRRKISTLERIRNLLPRDGEDCELILALLETFPRKLPDFVPRENNSIALMMGPLGTTEISTFGTRDYSKRLRLYVSAICAVQFLHKHGVVHRDLKPSNICVQDGDRALIVDLETAKILKGQSQLLPVAGTCGTIGYLAPELENSSYSKSGKYDVAVDVWSLGATACDLFADILPSRVQHVYNHTNPFRAHAQETEEFKAGRLKVCEDIERTVCDLRKWPRYSIENLVGQMLEVRPENRITAYDAVRHPALEEALLSYRESTSHSRKRRPGTN